MKKPLFWKMALLFLVCLAGFSTGAAAFEEPNVTNVQVTPATADLGDGADIQIAWQQSVAGKVDVMICDLDGNIVRNLAENQNRAGGGHTIQWDGTELNGRPCPVGAYLPIVKVKTDQGQVSIYNPTASEWGTELTLDPPVHASGQVTFQLPQPALCLLRLGKAQGGPCYGTLLNWAPRPAGDIAVPWNGKDAKGVIDLGQSEKPDFRLITIALPQNAIMITASPESEYPQNAGYKKIPLFPAHGENVFIHAQHQRKTCRDFEISAKVQATGKKWRGQPEVGGTVDITVTMVKDAHYEFLKKEQFEVYLYVDGEFVREEKRPDVPATISLDTGHLSNGAHIVTVGLRTLDDHMGVHTMKVNVKN